MEVKDIEFRKNFKGWRPNCYLSNLAIAYYEDPTYGYRRIFPVCQTDLPSGFFYTFSKADLARDGVRRKPDYGSTSPFLLGHSENSYSCHVDQIIIGLDKIISRAYEVANTPGSADPRRARVKTISEQIALHQEIEFAKKFFNASAWDNVWTGASAGDAANKKFKYFSSNDVDPVDFFDDRVIEIRRQGRRKPNKLALGVETFKALKNNPFILERIKYSGTTQNPAIVSESVLAQVFGVDEVVVLDATYNDAGIGEPENMKYVCDSKGALLLYTPDTPQIDMPSAGYLFTWRLDGGNYIAIDTFEKNDGSHTDFIEGLIAWDMQKTSDALACYFTNCVG